MDLISILATVILATTIATVIMGFVAYAAFQLRERRRPGGRGSMDLSVDDGGEPIFFTRYVPNGMDMRPAAEERSY